MNKKKSIVVMLFIYLALIVADVCVVSTYSLVFNMLQNSGVSISNMVFPWGNLISAIIPIITTIVSIGVVLMTSTKHTKIKSLVIIFASQLAGAVVSFASGYGLNALMGHLYGAEYYALYARLTIVTSIVHSVISFFGGFLLVFALGRYYDLQDYDELLDD